MNIWRVCLLCRCVLWCDMHRYVPSAGVSLRYCGEDRAAWRHRQWRLVLSVSAETRTRDPYLDEAVVWKPLLHPSRHDRSLTVFHHHRVVVVDSLARWRGWPNINDAIQHHKLPLRSGEGPGDASRVEHSPGAVSPWPSPFWTPRRARHSEAVSPWLFPWTGEDKCFQWSIYIFGGGSIATFLLYVPWQWSPVCATDTGLRLGHRYILVSRSQCSWHVVAVL